MPIYRHTLGSRTYVFNDLKEVMAKASPLKSGDCLAGIAAATEQERMAARFVLADLPLSIFLNEALIPLRAADGKRLADYQANAAAGCDLAIIVADGLSTRAIHENAVAFLDAFLPYRGKPQAKEETQ